MILHAGLVALRLRGLWKGALLLGPSGSGKSDLTLRCLDLGMRLVADDRVIAWRSGGRLYGRAPDTLRDLIEVRHLAVLPQCAIPLAEVVLAMRDAGADAPPKRVPEPAWEPVEGEPLPLLRLNLLEPSAPAKLRRALLWLGSGAEAP